MEFAIITKTSTQWTHVAIAFLAASLGFGAGWVAHRSATDRAMQLRPYQGPVPTLCTHDLVAAERECPGARTAIVAETPYEFRVDRRVLSCLLSAPSTQKQLAPNVLISPARDWQGRGFRIWSVRPGSLLARLGLKNGDTLRAVNGVPLSSPQSVDNAYARLRTDRNISIDLDRNTGHGRTRLHLNYRVLGGAI